MSIKSINLIQPTVEKATGTLHILGDTLDAVLRCAPVLSDNHRVWSLVLWRHCLLSDLEATLSRQASELQELSDDVTAMETELQQLLATLSELNPETIDCTLY